MTASRLTFWLLGGLCLAAGASCNKTTPEPNPDEVKVSYAQTQCADPWGLTQNTQQLRDAAAAYLKAKGVTPFPFTVSNTNPVINCAACTCPTGVLLSGTARTADLPALQAMGFVKL